MTNTLRITSPEFEDIILIEDEDENQIFNIDAILLTSGQVFDILSAWRDWDPENRSFADQTDHVDAQFVLAEYVQMEGVQIHLWPGDSDGYSWGDVPILGAAVTVE